MLSEQIYRQSSFQTMFITVLLVLGIFIRLVLSATTFHSDIRAFDLGGQIIAKGHLLDMYDYLGSLPKSDPLVKTYGADLLIYPPSIYVYHAIFGVVLNNLVSPEFSQNFLVNYQQVLGNPELNVHLVTLKIPYLVFDLLGLVFFMKLFKETKEKKMAAIFWIFNPVNLYATYMMGQFDLIPTVLVILALYFAGRAQKNDAYLSALFLGLGMAFKIYPLFLLVPLALVQNKFIDKLKLFLFGLLPYLVSIGPFLASRGFRASALIAGQTLKSLYAQIPISGGESLIIFPLLILLFYLIFAYSKSLLWQQFLIILLLFFIFTHYHPQWFLWLTPFLMIELIKTKMKHWPLVLTALSSFALLLFFFDSGLTIGIFSPLQPTVYNSSTIWQILHLTPDYNFLRSLLQTMFASVAIYYVFYYFPKVEK